MQERIQKILSAFGVASRREAERMIEAGEVTLNGRRAEIGDKADPETDKIEVRGKLIGDEPDKVYIMLNKPRGFVTTMKDERGRKAVAELVKDCPARVYPVGRLDCNSEGLLIMTNDGDAANRLMHPSHEVRKTYDTRVSGPDIDRSVMTLREPMELDGVKVQPVMVRIDEVTGNNAKLMITIGEGKNREIRRLCEAAGLEVRRLKRVSEGKLELGGLPCGKWRRLSQEEIRYIKEIK